MIRNCELRTLNRRAFASRAVEKVLRFDPVGGLVECVAGVLEAELDQDAARGVVVRMMAGEEGLRGQRAEGVIDHGTGGFSRQSLAPIRWDEMVADLVYALLGTPGAEAGAACEA